MKIDYTKINGFKPELCNYEVFKAFYKLHFQQMHIGRTSLTRRRDNKHKKFPDFLLGNSDFDTFQGTERVVKSL
jgi:hypothetical protein